MLGKSSLVIASLLLAASIAKAAPITYTVTVDTLSIAGTMGSLDFNFNPGSSSQLAYLQILDFAGDGALAGSPSIFGDVSGTLPGTLTFDNLTGLNDYFDGFTYGATLSFEVSLYGPALSSPDGMSISDSVFAFSMYSDPAGMLPTLTTDSTFGFAATLDVNLDGTTTVTDSSPQTIVALSSVVPEPGSLLLFGTGVLGIVGVARKRLFA